MDWDKFYAEIRQKIDEYGQNVIGVFGDDPFTYTIGNYEKGFPELLILGIDNTPATMLLNLLADKMKEQNRPFHNGEIVDIGGKVPLKVIDANPLAISEYTIQTSNFYQTKNYRVQQVIIPDKNGHYPGDNDCEEPYASVPVLHMN